MECLLAYSNMVTVPHKMVRLEWCHFTVNMYIHIYLHFAMSVMCV